MKYYAYTGDVKKLKALDYKFQKLYASNYKTYSKDRLIMYVTSKMILELDDVKSKNRTKFIEFILKNKHQPKEFWVRDEDLTMNPKHPIMYRDAPIWFLTQWGNIMTSDDFYDNRAPLWAKQSKLREDEEAGIISNEDVKNAYAKFREDEEFYFDASEFSLDLVKQIIELDNLHPLELREY